eukprot:GHVU01113950.1.p2 GENE.GHVU01113950.1~~GHVU01113950.1.p2  ORF type:complete len:162 (-),score=26.48 GHVU01113950.1:93-578(-)
MKQEGMDRAIRSAGPSQAGADGKGGSIYVPDLQGIRPAQLMLSPTEHKSRPMGHRFMIGRSAHSRGSGDAEDGAEGGMDADANAGPRPRDGSPGGQLGEGIKESEVETNTGRSEDGGRTTGRMTGRRWEGSDGRKEQNRTRQKRIKRKGKRRQIRAEQNRA